MVSQFDKDDVEAVGLVKFDFLGLRTLTILDWAVRYIRSRAYGEPRPDFSLETMPLDDPATYKIFASANTTAVFQFESRGMRDLLKQAQPGPLRGHHRAGGAVPSRPDGPDSRISSTASTASSASNILDPRLEQMLRRDLRHHGVPGAGDADRAGDRRLQPGRRRPAAPRDGQEECRGDGAAARHFRRRRGEERRGQEEGERDVRPDGEVRRLRLQQVARRRLRAGGLPDRLPEGAPSGGVHGGQPVGGNGRHRQGAQHLCRCAAPTA